MFTYYIRQHMNAVDKHTSFPILDLSLGEHCHNSNKGSSWPCIDPWLTSQRLNVSPVNEL